MAESWFALSRQDQAEALEVAADRTGRPAHLLEKDIWVVWALAAIYAGRQSYPTWFVVHVLAGRSDGIYPVVDPAGKQMFPGASNRSQAVLTSLSRSG